MTPHTPGGYNERMENSQLKNRLRRLEGQLQKLQLNITEGQDCTEVIPQFLAVKGAVAGAFETYVHSSLAECSAKDAEKTQKLIALLVRS